MYMYKLLALVVVLAAVAAAYPTVEGVGAQAPKSLSTDGQANLATKKVEGDLNAGEENDLKGAETFGFGYYPVVRTYGYGHGGYGGYGGYGGWGYGGGYGGYGNWNPVQYYTIYV